MKSVDDTAADYRLLVRDGYDHCAPAFNEDRAQSNADALTPLLARLPEGSLILDLGCGAGAPIAKTLSQRHRVVGVDLSAGQLALARRQAPAADFILADMATCAFKPQTYDAVVSFYAIFHLPRQHHEPLFRRMHGWLKSGGLLLASLAITDDGSYTEEFFGVEMYWSNYDMPRYRAMIADAGFDLLAEATLSHGYDSDDRPKEVHPIVFAQRRD